jgi:outer membrane protein OmpA-like peptidoglycan-associated protein
MLLLAMVMVDARANACAITAMCDSYLEELLRPVTPAYVDGASVQSWRDNWFVNVSGGASAFVGTPEGCEDLFGRIKPTMQIAVGKWHTPSVGNRVVFQGLTWENCELQEQKYRHYHADLLWNVTPSLERFDIIPLVGVGIIDNRTAFRRPFAINFGVQGRYKLTDFVHITAELGNAVTFRDADGVGESWRMGDNHLSLTAGVAWTFGRNVGWRKIVDARPYIQQNDRLAAYAYALRLRNDKLERMGNDNARVIAELRKVIEIEGLLDKYSTYFDGEAELHSGYPVNDYSGLNSLRKRMREGRKAGKSGGAYASADSVGYGDGECIGAPILFFFDLGTSELVNDAQLVNLDEIARVAIKHGLKIDIAGAADSETGNEQINDYLGTARAEYIAEYLTKKGVPAENITSRSEGGISIYTQNFANRNATVRLILP